MPDNFTGMVEESLTKLTGLSACFLFLFLILISCNFRVNLAATFYLNEWLSLSVIRESHPDS